MQDLSNYTLSELKDFLQGNGYPAYSATQVFSWIYNKAARDFSKMSNISKRQRQFLARNFSCGPLKISHREESADGTIKFLFALSDKSYIEAVTIPQDKRYTLCVSTQVGCKFGCKFCLSGESGLHRNLTTAEIINQYLTVRKEISPLEITNIVFMGIGEPLDNFSPTIKAIEIFTDPKGIHFSPRRLSLSTCGITPKIRELSKLGLKIKLSISLHSADTEIRSQLMPVNKKYPLAELIKTVRDFTRHSKHPVTFEYVLIKGINSKRSDARELARVVRGISCKVNLMVYNICYRNFAPPAESEIDVFTAELKRQGVFFTLRKSRGADINAACGQLRSKWE